MPITSVGLVGKTLQPHPRLIQTLAGVFILHYRAKFNDRPLYFLLMLLILSDVRLDSRTPLGFSVREFLQNGRRLKQLAVFVQDLVN